MNWLDKLERRFGRYAIRGLMKYIVGITAAVFALSYLDITGVIESKLLLIPSEVLKGEVWRLITFIFIPPTKDPIWVLFALYFYYIIGTALENAWGSFRFNLYYLIGMIGTILAMFITEGIGTATYINLSMFLAFAYMYPNYEILIFFILPVKVKYLGWLYWLFILRTLITAPVSEKVAAVVSIINFFVFFGPDVLHGIRNRSKVHYRRRKFKSQIPEIRLIHRCEVCGITSKDDPDMEFRYCSKCEGRRCYCMNHIKNHEHIKEDPEDKIIQFPSRDD
ncbi:rhomboid family intramembrane serine protease [Fonticella tunisiensis]|uniref:Rhomboid family protein n=1 Tax=Fonticella tunisiensis TaxID=1096341 RepID=A0A4R7KD26_9CLOT|nr:rhomboid family intramembrane serine protease [Fonticella tunisiensis]TDT51357.1 rhomboid family protein [Fonticella tunisiensis]